MTPPRPRILAAGVLLGLLLCTLLAGGASAYLRFGGAYAIFKSDFDTCLWRYHLPLARALHDNDALRTEIDAKQRVAFDHGGAKAANEIFWAITEARLSAAAGDDATRTCHAAMTNAFRALLASPSSCRLFYKGDLLQTYTGVGGAQAMRAYAACDEAAADGARRQSEPPPYLYGDKWSAATSAAVTGPMPLSPEDRAALASPDSVTDTAMCSANLKYNTNIDALTSPDGASFMRSQYAGRSSEAQIDVQPPPPTTPPVDALHCAAPGTRFVLNNFLQDGRPNNWTSLGRHGFDCAVLSAASGKRGVFRTLNDDLTDSWTVNPVRVLWPLSVGKSVFVTEIPVNDVVETQRISVAGFTHYWLPWGSVDAYAIQQEIWREQSHYVITNYWAPSLGSTIGRSSRAISGDVPDFEAQDYQLVAIVPPQNGSH